CVPGTVQVVSRVDGRIFLSGGPLRGTQCVAGEPGKNGAGLALVQLVAARVRDAGRPSAYVPMAPSLSARFDAACQPAANGGGSRGDPSLRESWRAIRFGVVDRTMC